MGTTSEVIRPFAKPEGPFRPPPDAAGDDQSSQGAERQSESSVLLIEDNPSDVKIITQALGQTGIRMRIDVASDGEQALSFLAQLEECAKGRLPSVILLDWNLPRVSGPEVLGYIRQSDRLSGIPVVVVTSTNSAADVREIRKLGANAHFRKPTDLDAYLALKTVVLELLSEPPEIVS